MASGITTYGPGPKLYVSRDITKADFMHVCDQMGCHPEPICEGGLRYINIPGYKSMRLQLYAATKVSTGKKGNIIFHRDRVDQADHWPCIKPDTPQAWRGNNEVVLHANQYIPTYLKAFENAKPFTTEEMGAWRAAFESVCIFIPKQKNMKQ